MRSFISLSHFDSLFRGALVLMALGLSGVSQAAPACRHVFSANESVSRFYDADPVRQWLLWEQKSNLTSLRQSSEPLILPSLAVDASSVNVTFANMVPNAVRQLILRGSQVVWFKHPFNTNSAVPYFNSPSTSQITSYLTASRSVALILGKNVFTIKMPNDRPQGREGQHQPKKGSTRESIELGRLRMDHIEAVDAKIGRDPDLILAKEVAIVSDKSTGEGYLIRDVSFLNDGNYYLPALSIPFEGRRIAQLNGQDPVSFWEKNYAEVLGRAKAKLLLRYGLQMVTPNPQNMLIQFDQNMRPTGKIVFRDLSDTIFVEGVAKGLGDNQALMNDLQRGLETTEEISPYWSNSSWRFDEAGVESFSRMTLLDWGLSHNDAYRKEIQQSLGLDLSQFDSVERNFEFDSYMASGVVRQKLQDYRGRLEALHRP